MYFKRGKFRVRISPLLSITAIFLVSILLWNLSGYTFCHRESKLCACHKCLTDSDPWFNDIISESPKPFMSQKHKPSEEDFNWWKTITPIADVEEPRPDRCRSCAVVGNSGNLRGSQYGPLIDFHDIVIRINRGRTKGFERDVGTKTTHHVMYPESATRLDNTTYLLFFPFKTPDFLWLLKSLIPGENGAPNSNKIANKDLVSILHPAFMKYVHDVWLRKKAAYPSTGFLAVVLSLLMCDEVNVFGFGADSEGNWSHYFEILTDKRLKTGGHPGEEEYKMIVKLHMKKKIFFFKGW
ncbi:CMP-N-acetylneuraminate-beta-galactosamide-alpha-2,3-sialyltransferase 1-like isoform X2 [Oreochromis niloticus]|uniref:CMP-N-acetylneuraminate-beta-galactosamide- alpha-2,3-sialyltransferase 1-like isoform X2 n=1 Tax=Oreochromis niloticus TaxID=8128 RepID=UPI000905C3AD|nr:CMP-N-acetylneuraminate-beta-galactosamide-alpha-2,3-sialyltransferase 1-like isoform X2 [Oreochromis niloticus]